MKDSYIADLARLDENQTLESHYLVLSKQQRTTRTAKPYLSLILGDNSGQIEARVWDPTDSRIAVDFSKGDVVKVRAAVSKFEGVLQLKIERLRKLTSTEFDRSDLLPATTYDVAELWSKLEAAVAGFTDPDLQRLVREDRERIPNFIEETLRLESPLRTQFRMARVHTTLGGVDIPAGSTLMLVPGAANRDPRIFERPYEFDIERPNARQHIAFGHGIHTCAGAPLARAEGRVTINRFLDRTADITISEEHHGPAGARHYEYLPTFFLRGLERLYLDFTPAA